MTISGDRSLVMDWHEDEAGVRHVTIAGEVDIASVADFSKALDAPNLDIDMSDVTFIDSTVIRALTSARINATEGFTMKASPRVRRVLELVNVDKILLGQD